MSLFSPLIAEKRVIPAESAKSKMTDHM